MEQGVVGAVVAALITSVAANWFNYKMQERQLQHAVDLQQQQWDQEAAWRQDDRRTAREDQQAVWNHANAEQERERDRAVLVQLQEELPRFSQVCRALHEDLMNAAAYARDSKNAGKSYKRDPDAIAFGKEFNASRVPVLATISHISNNKVRDAALTIYELNVAMVLSSPTSWDTGKYWGGIDPIIQQTDRQTQLIEMAGLLIRGASIDRFTVLPVIHDHEIYRQMVVDQQA